MSGIDEVCARLRPGHPALARRLIDALAADARVRCVLVTGSLATGLADRYSDLDLYVVVTDADAVTGLLGALPDLLGDLAYSATLTRGPVRVFTALTVDWLRVDVLLEPQVVATRWPHPPHLVAFDREHTARETGRGENRTGIRRQHAFAQVTSLPS